MVEKWFKFHTVSAVCLQFESWQSNFRNFNFKVQNTLTGNKATSRCPICHFLQSEFNKDLDFEAVEGACDFGLCTMHFGVRSMEWFLKIGYKSGKYTSTLIY